jgi:ferric-chelate reductase
MSPALQSFCLLCVISLSFFFSLALISSQTYYHRSACVPYVLTAVGLYAFDHLARVVRTRHTTGWLTAEHALNRGTTLVHVPSLRAGWRAGQHVRVRVVSGGWLAWLATWFLCRARPFTIAAGSDSGGVMLQIKALGSWTRSLLRVAGDADNAPPARRPEQISTNVERGRGSAREVRVIIEGPYGNY